MNEKEHEKSEVEQAILATNKFARYSLFTLWIALFSILLGFVSVGVSITSNASLKNDIKWSSDRFVYRQNLFAIPEYHDKVIKLTAVKRGLCVTSCLHLTPKGETVLEELGVKDRLGRIFLDHKDADFEYVYLVVLQDSFLQSQLKKYNKKHKDEPDNLTPEDLPAILGAIYAYCLNR